MIINSNMEVISTEKLALCYFAMLLFCTEVGKRRNVRLEDWRLEMKIQQTSIITP